MKPINLAELLELAKREQMREDLPRSMEFTDAFDPETCEELVVQAQDYADSLFKADTDVDTVRKTIALLRRLLGEKAEPNITLGTRYDADGKVLGPWVYVECDSKTGGSYDGVNQAIITLLEGLPGVRETQQTKQELNLAAIRAEIARLKGDGK
jgi:hypothetical protein